MTDIERTAMERASNGGGDLNRFSGGRGRRAAGGNRRSDASRAPRQASHHAPPPSGQRQNPSSRGRGARHPRGGSRKAEARSGESFFYEGDFSPSSGSESELYDRMNGSAAHRFNVNAPSFRPSSGNSVSVSLTASAPGIAFGPLPREVPPEESKRERKERKKLSRSDHFRVPANYLLNFTYERPTYDWSTPARRRTPVVEFKKERFLQANYRFVVNAGGNYVRHLFETDQLVDWDEIEQIVLQTPVPYNCPICLDSPMAP